MVWHPTGQTVGPGILTNGPARIPLNGACHGAPACYWFGTQSPSSSLVGSMADVAVAGAAAVAGAVVAVVAAAGVAADDG